MISHQIVINTMQIESLIPELLKRLHNDLALKVSLLQAVGLTEREIGMILTDRIYITRDGQIVEHAQEAPEQMSTSWSQPYPKLAEKERA